MATAAAVTAAVRVGGDKVTTMKWRLLLTESLKISTDSDLHDWFMERDMKDPAVMILNDKLMSDALFNLQPIKSEHSYSLNSDGDSLPDSPRSLQTKMDDMEDECYPAISLKTATSNTARLRHDVDISSGVDPKCLAISVECDVTPMELSTVETSNHATSNSKGANTLLTTATVHKISENHRKRTTNDSPLEDKQLQQQQQQQQQQQHLIIHTPNVVCKQRDSGDRGKILGSVPAAAV
ncbi:cyclic AMP response element-binding protein A-like [Rhagoletis pomonella]|uniref:cyclic AMP response element-binding protein A-like n=1 Tax=Rhagoletis pomonella TaxID=28610 RepID=UPI0017865087|nr:cyclic AMP response element-binding protein A-like [Rhagoletis pomonella]